MAGIHILDGKSVAEKDSRAGLDSLAVSLLGIH